MDCDDGCLEVYRLNSRRDGSSPSLAQKSRLRDTTQVRVLTSSIMISLKRKAVVYKGGGCIVCGYDKCDAALEFHHLDPEEKDFSISSSSSWRKIKNELDKCVLLCCRCHREVHFDNLCLHKYMINSPSSSEGDELVLEIGEDPYY